MTDGEDGDNDDGSDAFFTSSLGSLGERLEGRPSVPKAGLKCGINLSIKYKTTAPRRIPNTATHAPPRSRDGTNRLKDVAVNITPAANPSIVSNNLSEIRLVNNTGRAPKPVAKPATKLAIVPINIISPFTNIT